MADTKKYFYPPAPPSGDGTFSPDLVGFQVVDGGGLTQGNFEFTTAVVEKVNRTFNLGVFSEPLSLLDLDVQSLAESKAIIAKNFRVYPNYDISQVTNYSYYGSLQKRLEVSITKIINYFPASLQVNKINQRTLVTGQTATNISYDSVDDSTTFDIDVTRFVNPFDIDYSVNATRNIEVRPMEVSPYRNLTREYLKYALYVNNLETEYKFVDFDASQSLSAGTVTVTVEGNPFSGQSTTTDTLVLRPNKLWTEYSFKEFFDEVEDFLLNRMVNPPYTAVFNVVREDDNGNFNKFAEKVTWPKGDLWNLDIVTSNFDTYLTKISEIGELLDSNRTDLIVRFLTTGAVKEFDTGDQKVQKILQIYGRSFDESKKFIDALSFMTSVNYLPKNDIPSQLLKNLAQTLGWNTNISPITNDGFLNSVFGAKNQSIYPGQTRDKTPDEINFQFYRNLILNSGYLFRSKGTRKSIQALMSFAGAPKALTEFNEIVYVADGPINMERFNGEFLNISGGTKVEEVPVLDPSITFSIQGTPYTGFSTSTLIQSVDTVRGDYPVDENGYPIKPLTNNDFFFEKGSGWFEQTPQHRAVEQFDAINSTFTGQNPNIQTTLETYTYGQKYFDRYRKFPYMNLGFNITKTIDNYKSWTDNQTGLRISSVPNYEAYYKTSDERLVLNAKNVELYLNMGQGLLYDIWQMSNTYNYPIPSTGLTSPYPSPQGRDWTVINPQPKKKTFFQFAQTFYKNLINARSRQTLVDAASNGYPTLQSIYWKYLQSDQTVNIPSNKYTYQKMIDFTLGIGDYWMRLVEQMIPASTIWLGGQKMENSVLHRQKHPYRYQRGCEEFIIPCIPCQFDGSIFSYDCIDQTLSCPVSISSMSSILNNSLVNCTNKSGYTINNCTLSTMVSEWYVDLRLDNDILVQRKFYTGYGSQDIPTQQDWYDALDTYLEGLYNEGLNYSLNNGELIISNSGCMENFTNKTLKVNIGVNISINCN